MQDLSRCPNRHRRADEVSGTSREGLQGVPREETLFEWFVYLFYFNDSWVKFRGRSFKQFLTVPTVGLSENTSFILTSIFIIR